MALKLEDISENPYQNFITYLNNDQTRAMYLSILEKFLKVIPKEIFVKNLGKSGNTVPELATLFVELAQKDIGLVRQIIHAYVRELKDKQIVEKTKDATLKNQLKPIVALFDANEIGFSWKVINKGIPKAGLSKDRAYTREELQTLMLCACDILDKLIIVLFSSAGFRLGAWDYLTWNDVIFFSNPDGSQKGLGLRIYAGDAEEYWTHATPEAQKILLLYREEWKERFGKYPEKSDPFIVPARIYSYKTIRPLSSRGVSSRVLNMLKRSGLKGINVQTDNGFRKYFNTMCRRAKVFSDDREDMMGHYRGLQKHYERYEELDFERFPEYQKAISFLAIDDAERKDAVIQRKDQEITELQAEKENNTDLQKQLDEMKPQLAKLEKYWLEENITKKIVLPIK